MVAFSISEPLGVILQMVDERYWVWAQHLTWICVILLIIEMLTYYLYYSVATVTRQNEQLLMLRHKSEMEEEKYEVNRVNYEDLRMLRHELKNHSFYMRSLLEAGKYEQLREYLSHTADAEVDKLQSFDCGNYMVDVVINHAVNAARQQGVYVQTQIVVPSRLP